MLQAIILALILAASVTYLVWRTRRSLSKPDCGCGHESDCPYSRNFPPPAECPHFKPKAPGKAD
jgi:hypothetical protein